MDPTRDNPIIRFTTFWLGLGTFLVFALLFGVIWVFNRNPAPTMEDTAAQVRYDRKAILIPAQAASLPQNAIDAAIPDVAKKLATSKPTVAKPLVPSAPIPPSGSASPTP